MKIYIDFDDVICETAKYFTKIAKELFNIDVPYREAVSYTHLDVYKRQGNDQLKLVRLKDDDFQDKMKELDEYFISLHKEIYLSLIHI